MRRPRALDALSDPGFRAALVMVGIALCGLVAIGLAWQGLAPNLDASVQLPFLVSGGLGGVALAGTGAVLFTIHLDRRAAAVRRAQMDQIVRRTATIADAMHRRQLKRSSEPKSSKSFVLVRSTAHRRDCRIVADRTGLTRVGLAKARDARACRVCRPFERES